LQRLGSGTVVSHGTAPADAVGRRRHQFGLSSLGQQGGAVGEILDYVEEQIIDRAVEY
jgi:hypothetical protein